MPEEPSFSFAASLQYRADRLPSSRHERPVSSSAPLRSREIFRRLSADGSFAVRSVSENCHHAPSMRVTRPSFSIALRIFWLIVPHLGRRHRAGVAHAGEAEEVARKLRPLGMEDEGPAHARARRRTGRPRTRRCRAATPDPAAGSAEAGGLPVVQSSCAKTNAAKSTSRVSSSRRSSVDVPGLKDVVQGSTRAMSLRPRVSACSSFSCFPDEPRKIRGLSIGPSKRPPARHFQHAPRIPSSGLWHLPRARAANGNCRCNGVPARIPPGRRRPLQVGRSGASGPGLTPCPGGWSVKTRGAEYAGRSPAAATHCRRSCCSRASAASSPRLQFRSRCP